MTFIVYIGQKMFQFILNRIVGKETITIRRYPDNATRIVHNMITLKIDIAQLILGNQPEFLYSSTIGCDIGKTPCVIKNPVITTIIHR